MQKLKTTTIGSSGKAILNEFVPPIAGYWKMSLTSLSHQLVCNIYVSGLQHSSSN